MTENPSSLPIEREETYIASNHSLGEALDLLWPRDGLLHVGDAELRLERLELSTYVHVYHADTDRTRRRRLKFGWRGQSVAARHETKIVIPDGKLHAEHSRWARGGAALELIAGFCPVCAAFAKRRATLVYRGVAGESLVVGIDRVVAFNPADHKVRGQELLYLEFEGWRGRGDDETDEMNVLMQQVGSFARCADWGEAKWEMAKPLCPPQSRLAVANVDAACSFLAEVAEWFGDSGPALSI
jgi:hypothetical protein